MRSLLIVLSLASAVVAAPPQAPPLPRPGIEEAAVPCEVQANRKAACCEKCGDDCRCVGGCGCEAQAKAAAARCRTCGESCTCYGTCVCDREAAARAAAQPRPGRDAIATEVMAVKLTVPYTDGPGGRVLFYREMTVADWLASGRSVDEIPGMPEAHRAAVRGKVVSAAPAPVMVRVPAPPRTRSFSAGFNYSGPNVQFGAQACAGGT